MATLAAKCWAGGRPSQTTHNFENTPERITITRRHHPLQGQGFSVLKGGRKVLTIRLSDGTSTRVPRDWTDADGVQAQQRASRDGHFTVDSLRALLALVDVFGSR